MVCGAKAAHHACGGVGWWWLGVCARQGGSGQAGGAQPICPFVSACPALAWCHPLLPPRPGAAFVLVRSSEDRFSLGSRGSRSQSTCIPEEDGDVGPRTPIPEHSCGPEGGGGAIQEPGFRQGLQMLSVGRCCRSSWGDGDDPSGPDPRVEGLGTSRPAIIVPWSWGSPAPRRDRQAMPCLAWGWGSSSVAPWGRGAPRARYKQSTQPGWAFLHHGEAQASWGMRGPRRGTAG